MAFNQLEKNYLISQLEKALEAAKKMPVEKDCVSCYYFDGSGVKGICKMVDQEPPAEIKEKGCEAYAYDPHKPPF